MIIEFRNESPRSGRRIKNANIYIVLYIRIVMRLEKRIADNYLNNDQCETCAISEPSIM